MLGNVGHWIFASDHTKGIFESDVLNENIVLLNVSLFHMRALEIKGEPFLNTRHAGTPGEIQKQGKIQDNRSRKNRISTQKVDLDLHFITKPSEDIDIVPAFLGVTARRIIIDPDFVVQITVQIRVKLRLKDRIENSCFRDFLRFKTVRVIKPVLKSFPAIGTSLSSANCSRTGESADRFGAPLA